MSTIDAVVEKVFAVWAVRKMHCCRIEVEPRLSSNVIFQLVVELPFSVLHALFNHRRLSWSGFPKVFADCLFPCKCFQRLLFSGESFFFCFFFGFWVKYFVNEQTFPLKSSEINFKSCLDCETWPMHMQFVWEPLKSVRP